MLHKITHRILYLQLLSIMLHIYLLTCTFHSINSLSRWPLHQLLNILRWFPLSVIVPTFLSSIYWVCIVHIIKCLLQPPWNRHYVLVLCFRQYIRYLSRSMLLWYHCSWIIVGELRVSGGWNGRQDMLVGSIFMEGWDIIRVSFNQRFSWRQMW